MRDEARTGRILTSWWTTRTRRSETGHNRSTEIVADKVYKTKRISHRLPMRS